MEKKINELTETELKALLYDQIVILERTNNNIKFLQAELENRNKEK